MDTLKPNMYVRTKKGIAKIIGKNDDIRHCYPNAYITDTYLEINDDTEYVYEEDIVKASYNIIDILEVGDYVSTVTGECAVIAGVYNDINSKKYLRLCNCIGDYYEDNIKSIITHEQMEQMAYKVGE